MEKKPFLVIFITVFMDLVGFGIVIPLNPYLARQFGADPLQVGLLMTIFSALQFLASPLWGQLSDRIGRRPVILVSVLGAAIAHVGFGFAGTLAGLFLARAFAGIFGGNISAAMAAVADITKPQDRAKGMGLIGAAFGLGFIFGPFLGGILGDVGPRLGEQAPFGASFPAVVAGGICFLNFLLALWILPETNPHVLGKNTQPLPARRPRLALLWALLRKPVLNRVLVIYFLMSLAMAHMEAALFMLVQDRFQWDLTKASWGFAYVGVIIAMTQGGLIRKTLPRLGEANSFMIGLALMALGFFGVALSPTVVLLAVAVTVMALGNGFANPALTASVSLLSPQNEQGGSMGVNQSLSALGRILGPAAGGWLYLRMGMPYPFFVAGSLVTLAVLIGFQVRGQVPHQAK
ncbi:MAG: MFS transporter [Bdellovibrionales bacterium]